MLEAGFARSRESVNILVEGIVDTCICGVTFWAWGFAFMFEPGNGFIGTHRLLPARASPTPTARPASRCSRSGSSSSRSPTPARRSPRARWSAAAASSATSSTASASPASSIRSSATGPGARMAGWPSMAVPFRDFAGSTVVHTHRRRHLAGRRDRARSAARPRLPARRRRPAAAAQHHPRRGRRPDPLVRLVRLQPGQHAVGAGRAGHRPRLLQHDAGGLLGGPDGALLRLRARRQVGPRPHDQRLPRRPRRHHLPVLLGQPDRRVLHRHRRRRSS